MIQAHKRSINHLQRLKDYWDCKATNSSIVNS
jgi:hypothetical protein